MAQSHSDWTHERFQDGDLVFHQSQSSQSAAIRAVTGSNYTHVGMVFTHEGSMQVIEAVEPVKWTPIDDWISRGAGGIFLVYRLRDTEVLNSETVGGLKQAAESYIGDHYDLLFEWSDDKSYCSELVYKAYKSAVQLELGNLVPLSSLDLSSAVAQELIERRVQGNLDLDQVLVTPASMLQDSDLTLVYSNDPNLPANPPP